MNAITQSPINYHVPKVALITSVEENSIADQSEGTFAFLRLGVTHGTDTVKVSGAISKENPTFDVVGLLKAAMIQHAKGEPKETRAIENAFPGFFMRDYEFKVNEELGKTLIAQQQTKFSLVSEILLMITGLVTATNLYVTWISTNGNLTEITGELLGTTRTISVSGTPDECRFKLTKALFVAVFGPGAADALNRDQVDKVVKFGFDPEILKQKGSLSAGWDEWLSAAFPPEPSEAVKEVAKAFANGEHENCLTKLVDFMFDKNIAWDPEQQLQRNITGKAHGAEVQLTVIHAVGNFFVKGYVGGRRLRIYKDHSTLQIYTTNFDVDFDMSRCSKSIPVHRQAEFEDWLIRLAKAQAEIMTNDANH